MTNENEIFGERYIVAFDMEEAFKPGTIFEECFEVKPPRETRVLHSLHGWDAGKATWDILFPEIKEGLFKYGGLPWPRGAHIHIHLKAGLCNNLMRQLPKLDNKEIYSVEGLCAVASNYQDFGDQPLASSSMLLGPSFDRVKFIENCGLRDLRHQKTSMATPTNWGEDFAARIVTENNLVIAQAIPRKGGITAQASMALGAYRFRALSDTEQRASTSCRQVLTRARYSQLTERLSNVRPKNKLLKILLAGGALTYCMPLVAALDLSTSTAFRVGSGTATVGSAFALIPLRTIEGISKIVWIVLYAFWFACFCPYLWTQLCLIPRQEKHKRNFFLFCSILTTLHFCIAISAQSSILEGFTIFGPTIATASVYLISLLFAARNPEAEAAVVGGAAGLAWP